MASGCADDAPRARRFDDDIEAPIPRVDVTQRRTVDLDVRLHAGQPEFVEPEFVRPEFVRPEFYAPVPPEFTPDQPGVRT